MCGISDNLIRLATACVHVQCAHAVHCFLFVTNIDFRPLQAGSVRYVSVIIDCVHI